MNLNLMCLTPLHGNTCKSQLYVVEILEALLLFCERLSGRAGRRPCCSSSMTKTEDCLSLIDWASERMSGLTDHSHFSVSRNCGGSHTVNPTNQRRHATARPCTHGEVDVVIQVKTQTAQSNFKPNQRLTLLLLLLLCSDWSVRGGRYRRPGWSHLQRSPQHASGQKPREQTAHHLSQGR